MFLIRSQFIGLQFLQQFTCTRYGFVRRTKCDYLRGSRPGGDEVREFIQREAWGHHASCTCPIGAKGDPLAVLDGDFRVRGTTGLRVVDASVFPRIPGLFIVSAIYMISEKATDAILADAASGTPVAAR